MGTTGMPLSSTKIRVRKHGTHERHRNSMVYTRLPQFVSEMGSHMKSAIARVSTVTESEFSIECWSVLMKQVSPDSLDSYTFLSRMNLDFWQLGANRDS